MRSSPAIPFVLATAGLLQAFPFVVGRPMEYSVLRRGGEEGSVVTLLPVGYLPDTGKGVNWKIGVTDSLVAGVRKGGETTPAVLSSEIFLHVEDAYAAWTTKACEVPWDVASPQSNPIPLAKWPWGMRSLVCAGGASEHDQFQSLSFGRMVSQDHSCDESKLACISYKASAKHPMPEGQWSDDSGWISYQDGATGDSWVLNRIGDGPRLSEVRLWSGRNIRDVRRNDVWIFTRIVEWSWMKFGKSDSGAGRDSTWIGWTAISRIGDTGLIGTWRVARRMEGSQAGLDTFVVDFDSPRAYLESRAPADLALAVLVRSARPPLEPSATSSRFEWSNTTVGTSWGSTTSLTRTYSYSTKGEFEGMEQGLDRTAYGYGVDPSNDTTTTITLRSFERNLSSAVGSAAAGSRSVAPRTIAELERLVAEGGRILSIRDIRGASVDLAARDDSKGKGKTPNVLVFQALSSEGILLQGRILSPAVR